MIGANWNVVVTARSGEQRMLRRALSRLARLRSSGYRNVFLARVDDPDAFLAQVADLYEQRPGMERCLSRLLPLDRTFAVDAAGFTEQLAREVLPLLEQIAGGTFHVRVERRGHKGVIDSPATERALGDVVVRLTAERANPATVTFGDPDAILAVEIVGAGAGLGVISRERRRFPFVKID
jgi:tRNA(Ser,Leu) C12 N-acetylase TAN1